MGGIMGAVIGNALVVPFTIRLLVQSQPSVGHCKYPLIAEVVGKLPVQEHRLLYIFEGFFHCLSMTTLILCLSHCPNLAVYYRV